MHDADVAGELIGGRRLAVSTSAPPVEGAASVHLRVRGRPDEDELTALRQQLALCLSSDVRDIRVHVEDSGEVDLEVLRALNGVAVYLQRRGGALTLVGSQRPVRAKIAIYELDGLRTEGPVRRRQVRGHRAGEPAAPSEQASVTQPSGA